MLFALKFFVWIQPVNSWISRLSLNLGFVSDHSLSCWSLYSSWNLLYHDGYILFHAGFAYSGSYSLCVGFQPNFCDLVFTVNLARTTAVVNTLIYFCKLFPWSFVLAYMTCCNSLFNLFWYSQCLMVYNRCFEHWLS